jgi:YD repeat-containing protein
VATHCTYDRAGRRTSEVGPDGRIEFTWGDLGWLTSVTGPQGRLLVPAGSAG